MSRRKKTPFAPWESNTSNGLEDRFIRIGETQLMSAAMKRLGDKANRLFVYMKLEARGKREFAMPYTKIMKVMPISRPTIKTTIEELERAGFIDILERNGNVRKPNLYAFSTRWREMEKKCKSAVKPFYQSKAKLVKPFYQ